MSIGEDLAEARRRAGLTVTEVSQRTRIRETIIRCIERDNFAGCGGDSPLRAISSASSHSISVALWFCRVFSAGHDT